MSVPIKYRDNVIYNNEVYTVFSTTTKSDNVNIKHNKNGNTITVKKYQVRKLNNNKYDIVEYNNSFYRIVDFTTINYQNSNKVSYELQEYDKKKNRISVDENDKKIITIPNEYQEKLSSFLSFVEKYNSTIKYLKFKKVPKHEFIPNNRIIDMMKNLLFRCKLNINQLYKVNHALKKTQDDKLQIHLIYENPFDFIRQEQQFITFEKAEKICQEYNLNIDFSVKCEKWIYSLFNKENSFYLLNWKFNKEFGKFCERYNELASKIDITDFIVNIKIDGKEYKTTQFLLDTEINLTDLMMDTFYNQEYDNVSNQEIEALIETYETTNNKVFEEEQKNGIIKSIKNKFSIITGFPGTGKTEIVKCILYILSKLSEKYFPELGIKEKDSQTDNIKYLPLKNVSLMAPTGLAYVNLTRSVKREFYNETISGTCHRTLYHTFQKIMYDDDDEEFDNTDVKLMIVDETSMLDTMLFYELVKACKYFGSRLIIIGDTNQLPSIGPGIVLKNLIESGCFEVTKLDKIKRQNIGSLVSTIKKMTTETITYTKFKDDTISVTNSDEFINNGEINKEAIINLIDTHNLNKNTTKFITYFNSSKFKCNTNVINSILQDKFNPSNGVDNIPSNSKYDTDTMFRINDKIIRTENDYSNEKMRANGEEADILYFDGKFVTIKYNDIESVPEQVTIDDLYDNFKLNYCITIHKSQGSQYDNVVLFIEPNQNIIDKTSLYTAISRARNKCFVISSKEDFIKCQKNNNVFDNKVSLFMRRSNQYDL